LAGAQAVVSDEYIEAADSGDQLLAAVAKALAVKSEDADRPRALLKLFVPAAPVPDRDALHLLPT